MVETNSKESCHTEEGGLPNLVSFWNFKGSCQLLVGQVEYGFASYGSKNMKVKGVQVSHGKLLLASFRDSGDLASDLGGGSSLCPCCLQQGLSPIDHNWGSFWGSNQTVE